MPAKGNEQDFSEQYTLDVVRQVCAGADLDPGGARLLRLGENAMWALRDDPVVVRVARTADGFGVAATETRVARWLAEAEFSSVRLADMPGADAPRMVAGHPVTLWRRETPGPDRPSSQDLAEPLRRLHQLLVPLWLDLPAFDPFAKIFQWLQASAPQVESAVRSFLFLLYETLREQFDQLEFVFPAGVGHGDAHPGNLLRLASGQDLLHDFEAFSFGAGAQEWDLTATGSYRHGFDWISAEEYGRFVDVYGFDITSWDGFVVLRSIRELGMVAWMIQLVGVHPRAAEEFSRRVADLRTGHMPRRWKSL